VDDLFNATPGGATVSQRRQPSGDGAGAAVTTDWPSVYAGLASGGEFQLVYRRVPGRRLLPGTWRAGSVADTAVHYAGMVSAPKE
jgi:hypothetical protein